MELIETVQSSITFLSITLIILLVIAFGLYKIRNQAKKIQVTSLNKNQPKQVDTSTKKPGDLLKTVDFKTEPNQVAKSPKQKFEVINDKVEVEPLKEIRINYHSNVYKYYDVLDSTEMFKLKVKTENDK